MIDVRLALSPMRKPGHFILEEIPLGKSISMEYAVFFGFKYANPNSISFYVPDRFQAKDIWYREFMIKSMTELGFVIPETIKKILGVLCI